MMYTLSQKSLSKLDLARKFAGVPFTITSSWRSKSYNMEIGGANNSAHLRGTAFDIACMSSHQRMVIVSALYLPFLFICLDIYYD